MGDLLKEIKERTFSKYKKDSWEVKTLGEIAVEMKIGNGIYKSFLNTGNYPAIRHKDIYDTNITLEKCVSFVDESKVKRKVYTEKGNLLMTAISNIKENLGKSCSYLGSEKCLIGENIVSIKTPQNTKFLSYFLSTKNAKEQIQKISKSSTVLYMMSKDIKQIQIPLPPLEEQNKVVEKLDIFYKIINDLKEGIPLLIQKNREQYNFYKELLLEKK